MELREGRAPRSGAPFGCASGGEEILARWEIPGGSGGRRIDHVRRAGPRGPCDGRSSAGSASCVAVAVRSAPGRRAAPRRSSEPAMDDRLDLRQGPPEAGAGEAVQERREIRRFPGLEAAGQQGAVGRLEACRHRPIHRLGLEIHRLALCVRPRTRLVGPAGSVRASSVRMECGRDDPSVPVRPVLVPRRLASPVSSRRWTTSTRSIANRRSATGPRASCASPACSTRIPKGMRPKDIAERLGMSVRNVYRDLKALEGEVGLPTWSEEGRWGILESAFLPPLKLNLSEAMAVFLGARLMVRYADKYDPDLASAFEKLAASLPDPLREHVGAEPRRAPGRAARPGVHRARPAADPGLGGPSRRRDHLRGRRLRGPAGRAHHGASSGRTSSSHRCRPTPCT